MTTTFRSQARGPATASSGALPGALRVARHLDPLLLLAALGLSVLGLVVIYSATLPRGGVAGDPSQFVQRQLVSLAVGVTGMIVVTLVDYRALRVWAPLLYAGALVLLGLVLVHGTVINGSRSWLVLGGVQLQPSELAKPALLVMLAALFHERREGALGLRALLEALVLAALPMLLILAQPDFGTFLVFVALICGVLLVAGVKIRYLAALALLGAVAIAGVLQPGVLEDYQMARLTSFLDPGADLRGAGYNVNQAQIAIGSGQLVGQGLFQGSQTGLSYVPENHTDFIFTVVGEELGFLGAAAVLGAYGLLLLRGLRVAATARDTFGALLAAGVVIVLAFQMFINVGMTIGLAPVTGLPLPFVSYGGTSLIASLLMVGLVENVALRRFS